MLNAKPAHWLGYPESQLAIIFDAAQQARFLLWMRGQTVAQIDGENVYYTDDVKRWCNAERIVD